MSDWFEREKFWVNDPYGRVVAPCLSFTIWVRYTVPEILLDLHEQVMATFGSLYTHYQADHMKYPAKVTPRSRTLVPTWIRKPAEFKFYFARFSGAADVHPASFEVHFQDHPPPTPEVLARRRVNLPKLVAQGFLNTGQSTSTLRVTLPIEHPLAEPARFAAWVLGLDAVAKGEFVTGGCDLALNLDDTRGPEPRTFARAACARLPGLDVWNPSIHLWLHRYLPDPPELVPLVKRAGWITLVAERSLELLGGEAKLREALAGDPSVRIHPLAHGLAIQAGDAPRLGDLATGDVPYRSVAAAIRPVRVERVGEPAYPDEWMTGWLGMLDSRAETP